MRSPPTSAVAGGRERGSASTGRGGTAGSSRACDGPRTCPHRTGPDRPGDTQAGDTWDMAGQAPRGSRGHGRSSRPGSSSPPVAAASVAASGPAPTRTTPRRRTRDRGAGAGTPATRPVYRLLLMKGMTPAEAASLTAFICGLPTTDLHWSLKQVNQLLFLRRMQQTGRFGGTDGGRASRTDYIPNSPDRAGVPPPATAITVEAAPSLLPAPFSARGGARRSNLLAESAALASDPEGRSLGSIRAALCQPGAEHFGCRQPEVLQCQLRLFPVSSSGAARKRRPQGLDHLINSPVRATGKAQTSRRNAANQSLRGPSLHCQAATNSCTASPRAT